MAQCLQGFFQYSDPDDLPERCRNQGTRAFDSHCFGDSGAEDGGEQAKDGKQRCYED